MRDSANSPRLAEPSEAGRGLPFNCPAAAPPVQGPGPPHSYLEPATPPRTHRLTGDPASPDPSVTRYPTIMALSLTKPTIAMMTPHEIPATLTYLSLSMTQRAIADHVEVDPSLISRLRSGDQAIGRSYLHGLRLGQLASLHGCHLVAEAHGTGITAIETATAAPDGCLLEEMRDAVEAIGDASRCFSAGSVYQGLRAVARLVRAALSMRAEFNLRLMERAA